MCCWVPQSHFTANRTYWVEGRKRWKGKFSYYTIHTILHSTWICSIWNGYGLLFFFLGFYDMYVYYLWLNTKMHLVHKGKQYTHYEEVKTNLSQSQFTILKKTRRLPSFNVIESEVEQEWWWGWRWLQVKKKFHLGIYSPKM